MRSSTVGTCQYQDIVVRDFLLLVGKFEELLVNLVEAFAININAIHAQAVFQGSPAASCRQHDCVIVDTHILGIHDFVGRSILEDAILMDAAAVSERVPAHNRLVWLNWHVHQGTYHSTCREDFCRVDIRVDTQIGMRLEYHGNLFERGVASTFADAVYRHLCLTSAIQYASHGVSRSHSEVVVAMC